MTSAASRLRVLVLLLLFVSGGRNLPGLDAVLFHLNGQALHTGAHIESAEGCTSHADHCGLGIPASTTYLLATNSTTPIIRLDVSTTSLRDFDPLLVTDAAQFGFHSRAPPVSQPYTG